MKNKKIYLIISLVLIIGVAIGWLLKPATSAHDHAGESAGQNEHQEYTCSMHPQIRQEGPGKCPLCGMDLIPAASAGTTGEANPFILEMTPEAVALANIQTTTVQGGNVKNEFALTGKIKINEERLSSVTARFPGRIEKLFVNFTGQEVKKGERLASVYSPELITVQKELQEAAKMKDSQPALYEAAKEKLSLWGLTSAQIANIEKRNAVITSFDIYSGVSGVVTKRLVALGDYVATGTVLAEVADLSTLWVVLDAYENDLSKLKKGSKISFTVQGISAKTFEATIDYITPLLDQATRSAEVRAVVPNQQGLLKPEMFVNAKVNSNFSNTGNVLTVPETAVLWTGPRSVVYVKVPDTEKPSFEMREVTIGPKTGDHYIIENGLAAGEEIVSNGVFAVDGAAQLTGNYSMMTSPKNQQIEVSEAFQKQLTGLTQDYYSIKNALVNSDAAKAKNAAENFSNMLAKVDMDLLHHHAHQQWMKLMPVLQKQSELISQQIDIQKQREYFAVLSEQMLEAIEYFGTDNDLAYKQYCPMAFNDKGANWLSEVKEIRNPYFGEAMLACGEVKKIYRKEQQVKSIEKEKSNTNIHQH